MLQTKWKLTEVYKLSTQFMGCLFCFVFFHMATFPARSNFLERSNANYKNFLFISFPRDTSSPCRQGLMLQQQARSPLIVHHLVLLMSPLHKRREFVCSTRLFPRGEDYTLGYTAWWYIIPTFSPLDIHGAAAILSRAASRCSQYLSSAWPCLWTST